MFSATALGLALLVEQASAFALRPIVPHRTAGVRMVADTEVPKRRVALLVEPTPFTHVSGYANRFQEMLKHLENAGDDVVVATPDDVPEAPSAFGAFPVTTLPGFRFRPWYPQICLSFDFGRKALEMIQRQDPDIIHASSPGFLTLAATLYARLEKKPLLLSYHTHVPIYVKRYAGWVPFIEPITWFFIKTVHNFADLTITTSPQLRDELVSQGIQRVGVWNKGIDTQRFNPAFKSEEARSRLTAGHPEDPLIIYVGRLGVEKRIEELRAVLDQIPNLRLALVGAGPAEAELRRVFEEVSERVVFTGLLRGDELSEAFASADVFCMPSDSETLGFVVLESMASGVPVVGCNAGGIPSIIDDGVTSMLHEVADTAAIADKVRRLIDDDDLRSEMGAAARAEAEKWSWASSGETLRAESYAAAIENFRDNQRTGAY